MCFQSSLRLLISSRHSDKLWGNRSGHIDSSKVTLSCVRRGLGLKALNSLLQREYAHEVEGYKVDKKIANLMCDMGFLMSEEPGGQHQRLIKKTDRHMIVVTYKVRRRLITSPLNAKDEFAKEI